MQQVGGSIGTAMLSSIFATAAGSYAEGRRPTAQLLDEAAVHGYTVAFWVAAGIFAVGAVVVADAGQADPRRPTGARAAERPAVQPAFSAGA